MKSLVIFPVSFVLVFLCSCSQDESNFKIESVKNHHTEESPENEKPHHVVFNCQPSSKDISGGLVQDLDECTSDEDCQELLLMLIENHPHEYVRTRFFGAIKDGNLVVGFRTYEDGSGTMATFNAFDHELPEIHFNREKFRETWGFTGYWEEVIYHEYIHWVQWKKGIISAVMYDDSFSRADFDAHITIETEAYTASCIFSNRSGGHRHEYVCPGEDTISAAEVASMAKKLLCMNADEPLARYCKN